MTMRLFVPRCGAVAVGPTKSPALEQAAAKRGIGIEIIRTGWRALLAGAVVRSQRRNRVAFRPGSRLMHLPCSMPWPAAARMRCGLASPMKSPG